MKPVGKFIFGTLNHSALQVDCLRLVLAERGGLHIILAWVVVPGAGIGVEQQDAVLILAPVGLAPAPV